MKFQKGSEYFLEYRFITSKLLSYCNGELELEKSAISIEFSSSTYRRSYRSLTGQDLQ